MKTQNHDPKKLVEKFLKSETPFKAGNYVSDGKKFVYRTIRTVEVRIKNEKHAAWLRKNAEKGLCQIERMTSYSALVRTVAEDIFAVKVPHDKGTLCVGNSSVLQLVGRKMVYGREKLNRNETDIQKELALRCNMIPFSALIQAGLDVRKIEFVERGPEETVWRWESRWDSAKKKDVREKVDRHFTGATLFRVGKKYFLFDLDRNELRHGIFNPFLVELPRAAKTIHEAYESLKPVEVVEALAKGLDVKRQGEWFFIPCTDLRELNLPPDLTERQEWQDEKSFEPRPKWIELKAGNNRPNVATEGIEKLKLVRGTVEHRGREHAPIKLAQYHRAVPNTAVASFTITGDID